VSRLAQALAVGLIAALAIWLSPVGAQGIRLGMEDVARMESGNLAMWGIFGLACLLGAIALQARGFLDATYLVAALLLVASPGPSSVDLLVFAAALGLMERLLERPRAASGLGLVALMLWRCPGPERLAAAGIAFALALGKRDAGWRLRAALLGAAVAAGLAGFEPGASARGPVAGSPPTLVLEATLLALIGAGFAARRTLPVLDVALVLVLAAQSMVHARAVPALALVAARPLGTALDSLAGEARTRAHPVALRLPLVLALAGSAIGLGQAPRPIGLAPGEAAEALTAVSAARTGRLWCEAERRGPALWALGPERVLSDQATEGHVLAGETAALASADLALVPRGGTLDRVLREEGWRLVAETPRFALRSR
jgi:hypothetical protein